MKHRFPHPYNGYLVIIWLFHPLLWVLKGNKCSCSSYLFSISVVINVRYCLLLHYRRILNQVSCFPGRSGYINCVPQVLCDSTVLQRQPSLISEFLVNNILKCMLTSGDKGAERPENLPYCH